jgi:hypothetical protein
MAAAKHKKRTARAKPKKSKSAMNKLLDTMRDIIEEGARRMTPKEMEESERKFHAIVDRVARKRRRKTASSKPQRVEP